MSAPAFADDLHPMVDSKKDMQHQLDLITEFLKFNGMQMGLKKTWILVNQKKDHEDFPNQSDFK